ncbi:hypothetical protein GOP47_0010205 [Adiantum capillus-veneris]|uniref:Secreted protein n=1 Tax=Adiantum capillus-veneris TaxID=13818 RepID=A0A9D4ZG67_ADICA|nr:hypothetical protein GOP47_0010205 [Adiantum capillus-veneris]
MNLGKLGVLHAVLVLIQRVAVDSVRGWQSNFVPHAVAAGVAHKRLADNRRACRRMSLSKEQLHHERCSPIDRVTHRFFMIPREVAMLSYQIRSQGKISNDD